MNFKHLPSKTFQFFAHKVSTEWKCFTELKSKGIENKLDGECLCTMSKPFETISITLLILYGYNVI